MAELKVTSIRYFETRNGLGYQCKTNIPNVEIWNDGHGGSTFIHPCKEARVNNLYTLTENQLEELIDKHENGK